MLWPHSSSRCSLAGTWLRSCRLTASLDGRRPQSFFTLPIKLTRPVVLRRNSTGPVHSHSLLPYQSTPSEAQRKTIYALSTPPGKGGIAVIRVSGPDARKVSESVTRSIHDKPLIPRRAELRHVIDPLTGEKLDDGLVIFFKGPKSFTTEDVIELQVHSGRAVLSSVLRALSRLPYCRPALPGEFTRRAFDGGRLDLTQVEGLRDLIDAETDAQRRVAVSSAAGTQRARFDALRAQILDCLMHVEGFIDFGEDVDELGQELMLEQACSQAQVIIDSIRSHLSDNRRGEILRSGVKLAIFGPPNAGKSSLFNFLAERDAAITSPIPGTTRDILSLTLDIGGLPVVLNDTAGIRTTTDDAIEKIGVERAGSVIETSDVSICVLSIDDITQNTTEGGVKITIPDDVIGHLKSDTVFILNKSDLSPVSPDIFQKALNDTLLQYMSGVTHHSWCVSLRSGEGTREFLDGLTAVLKERYAYTEIMSFDSSPLITQSRHRDYLEVAVRHLEEFKSYSLSQIDIAAESLRYAARAIGAVSGTGVSTEEVLSAIFSNFCIGK